MKQAIQYTILASRPEAHLFEVQLRIEADGEPLQVALPAWIPGSYMIREFARHIVSIEARHAGRLVELKKLDKHTWQLAAIRGRVEIVYEVYAWDLSVRAAHLDQTHGFFNGSSVFLRVRGREDWPCTIDIQRPRGARYKDWRVATALRPAPGKKAARRHSFGLYRADNYDELIDHPVEMGNFALAVFEVCGALHEVAVTGLVPNLDLNRLTTDLTRLCSTQIEFFEPERRKAPFDRYVFLVTAVGEGYGGLEHRASTALLCARNDLPCTGLKTADDRYRGFLGLASHEYFHAWHVKRIKPSAFVPYDLDRECHTSLLWIFEGFTSYYDDLMLVRSGLLAPTEYLKALAKTANDVHRAPGRKRQSVAESSFDAWTKYYRPDENSPNAVVSYYAKGALVALCLDLYIRSKTNHERSLDDVMRMLWATYGRNFYVGKDRGLGEDEFVAIAERAVGIPLARQVSAFAYARKELPLAASLASFGVNIAHPEATDAPALGIKTRSEGDCLVIATAFDDGPASRSGLSGGDCLVAVGGIRVNRSNLDELLKRHGIGQSVPVHAFRRDELLEFEVPLEASRTQRFEFTLRTDQKAEESRVRWLGRNTSDVKDQPDRR